MKQFSRLFVTALSLTLLLTACSKLPDHAKYIPKDALAVVGVNTSLLSKKIAWSAITGSNLLDEMSKATNSEKGKEIVKDAENAGIDYDNTLYYYVKNDQRYRNTTKMAVVLPLADAGKWETFIKKQLPAAAVKTVGDRKEMPITDKFYAGWTDKVLIVMNNAEKEEEQTQPSTPATASTDTLNVDDMPMDYGSYQPPVWVMDEATTLAEMQNAFATKKDESILKDDRFNDLEKAGHDVTMFFNYGTMMDTYGGAGMNPLGLGMGGALWHNSALTTGVDFKEGRITADMNYFTSDSMKSIMKKMGATNLDKDMLDRLPAANLNMLAGYHLSTDALKEMFQIMSLTGIMNMALVQQGISLDEIMSAFTGDFVFSLNNFTVKKEKIMIDPVLAEETGDNSYETTTPSMDYVVAIKIGKKEAFAKVLALLEKSGVSPTSPGNYTIPMGNESLTLMTNEEYAVAANSPAACMAYMKKENKGAFPEDAASIKGHPLGFYADIQSFTSSLKEATSGEDGPDSARMAEVAKIFSTFNASGGEYSGNSAHWTMELKFMNKEENALVQLLNLAKTLAAIEETDPQGAMRAPVQAYEDTPEARASSN